MNLTEFKQKYDFDLNSEPIGKGGFGSVYKGVEISSGKIVAIKKSEVKDDSNKYSLLEEANLTKRLSHPNLLKYKEAQRINTNIGLFDFGVMDFIKGGDLSDFMKSFPSMEKIDEVLIGILSGLEYLHSKNIVHRDLKPANILIQYKQNAVIPKIIDFGISKAMSSEQSALSNLIGSYEYMSPEQLGANRGGKISTNSDLWTIGVIVYQLMRGELPFGARNTGHTSGQIINNIIKAELPKDIEQIPSPYKEIVKTCLVKNPERRIKNPKKLIDAIKNKQIILENPKPEKRKSPKHNKKQNKNNKPTIAPNWRRFIAFLTDIFVFIILTFILIEFSDFAFGVYSDFSTVVPVVIPAIYLLIRDSLLDGASLGKRMMGIQVINEQTGNLCTKFESIKRNAFLFMLFYLGIIFSSEQLVIAFYLFFFLEAFICIINQDNKGLTELVTNTKAISKHTI